MWGCILHKHGYFLELFPHINILRFYLHSCSCPRQTVLCPKIFAVLLGILALAASDPEQVHYSVCACSGECGWGRSNELKSLSGKPMPRVRDLQKDNQSSCYYIFLHLTHNFGVNLIFHKRSHTSNRLTFFDLTLKYVQLGQFLRILTFFRNPYFAYFQVLPLGSLVSGLFFLQLCDLSFPCGYFWSVTSSFILKLQMLWWLWLTRVFFLSTSLTTLCFQQV